MIFDEFWKFVEETGLNSEEDKSDLVAGKNYLVMMCQSWSVEGKLIRFMAARWCLDKMSGQRICRKIQIVIALLESFHF